MTNAYGRDTTTDEVLEGMDLTGRRFVITGAASGLGRESARALAAHGASVTLVARSPERAEGAVAEVGAMVPGADLEAGVADLGDHGKHPCLRLVLSGRSPDTRCPRQQRRGDGVSYGEDRGRIRDAVRYQSPRPFPVDGLALPGIAVRGSIRVW